mmetsp:Transcript_38859/g.62273  ORF Transcript_38859/g.62273 Transcript_38859/m.62273 type:complete len:314 (-) Transcript_38859:198-1139(-)
MEVMSQASFVLDSAPTHNAVFRGTFFLVRRTKLREFKDSDRRGGDPNRVGQKEDEGAILSTRVGRTDIGMNLSTRGVYSTEERKAERLLRANVEIRDLARKLHLKQRHAQFVIEMYKRVFDVREATDVKEGNEVKMRKDFNGPSVEALIGACFYWAAKKTQVARSIKDISAKLTNITHRELKTAIKRILKHKHYVLGPMKVEFKVTQPSQIVKRKAHQLKLSDNIGHEAAKIAEAVMLTGCMEGKPPDTIAGACLLIALEGHEGVKINSELLQAAFDAKRKTLEGRAREIKASGISDYRAALKILASKPKKKK